MSYTKTKNTDRLVRNKTVKGGTSIFTRRYIFFIVASCLSSVIVMQWPPNSSNTQDVLVIFANASFTLIGFIITALALYVTMTDRPVVKYMSGLGMFSVLVFNFKVATVSLVCCFFLTLGAILYGLPFYLVIASVVFATCCLSLAFARLFFTIKQLK